MVCPKATRSNNLTSLATQIIYLRPNDASPCPATNSSITLCAQLGSLANPATLDEGYALAGNYPVPAAQISLRGINPGTYGNPSATYTLFTPVGTALVYTFPGLDTTTVLGNWASFDSVQQQKRTSETLAAATPGLSGATILGTIQFNTSAKLKDISVQPSTLTSGSTVVQLKADTDNDAVYDLMDFSIVASAGTTALGIENNTPNNLVVNERGVDYQGLYRGDDQDLITILQQGTGKTTVNTSDLTLSYLDANVNQGRLSGFVGHGSAVRITATNNGTLHLFGQNMDYTTGSATVKTKIASGSAILNLKAANTTSTTDTGSATMTRYSENAVVRSSSRNATQTQRYPTFQSLNTKFISGSAKHNKIIYEAVKQAQTQNGNTMDLTMGDHANYTLTETFGDFSNVGGGAVLQSTALSGQSQYTYSGTSIRKRVFSPDATKPSTIVQTLLSDSSAYTPSTQNVVYVAEDGFSAGLNTFLSGSGTMYTSFTTGNTYTRTNPVPLVAAGVDPLSFYTNTIQAGKASITSKQNTENINKGSMPVRNTTVSGSGKWSSNFNGTTTNVIQLPVEEEVGAYEATSATDSATVHAAVKEQDFTSDGGDAYSVHAYTTATTMTTLKGGNYTILHGSGSVINTNVDGTAATTTTLSDLDANLTLGTLSTIDSTSTNGQRITITGSTAAGSGAHLDVATISAGTLSCQYTNNDWVLTSPNGMTAARSYTIHNGGNARSISTGETFTVPNGTAYQEQVASGGICDTTYATASINAMLGFDFNIAPNSASTLNVNGLQFQGGQLLTANNSGSKTDSIANVMASPTNDSPIVPNSSLIDYKNNNTLVGGASPQVQAIYTSSDLKTDDRYKNIFRFHNLNEPVETPPGIRYKLSNMSLNHKGTDATQHAIEAHYANGTINTSAVNTAGGSTISAFASPTMISASILDTTNTNGIPVIAAMTGTTLSVHASTIATRASSAALVDSSSTVSLTNGTINVPVSSPVVRGSGTVAQSGTLNLTGSATAATTITLKGNGNTLMK
jgi:hypothetical protein